MWQEKLLKSILSKIKYGQIKVITPSNKTLIFKGDDSIYAEFIIKDWNIINKTVKNFDIGLGESYMEGHWESDNLTNLLTIFFKNRTILEKNLQSSWLSKRFISLKNFFIRNTISKSKKNTVAHYDHGNDFYSLWLDPSMTYSSGIFKDDCSLEEAQKNKYKRILEKIGKSENILEIGCGWGGFADFVSNKKYKITAYANSSSQISYTKERLKNKENVKIILDDYRNIKGQYSSVVSIGMFEHVGQKFWSVYFNKVRDSLKPNGKALIQTIVTKNKNFEKEKNRASFLCKYIFPGAHLPTIDLFKKYANKAGLEVKDIYIFGDNYAKTLECWLNNFNANIDNVEKLGYDNKFIKCWQFYLSLCQASFLTKESNVMQALLIKKS